MTFYEITGVVILDTYLGVCDVVLLDVKMRQDLANCFRMIGQSEIRCSLHRCHRNFKNLRVCNKHNKFVIQGAEACKEQMLKGILK